MDVHSQTALDLFGEASIVNRTRAKIINYMKAYDASEITLARKAGQYPLPRFTAFKDAH